MANWLQGLLDYATDPFKPTTKSGVNWDTPYHLLQPEQVGARERWRERYRNSPEYIRRQIESQNQNRQYAIRDDRRANRMPNDIQSAKAVGSKTFIDYTGREKLAVTAEELQAFMNSNIYNPNSGKSALAQWSEAWEPKRRR